MLYAGELNKVVLGFSVFLKRRIYINKLYHQTIKIDRANVNVILTFC